MDRRGLPMRPDKASLYQALNSQDAENDALHTQKNQIQQKNMDETLDDHLLRERLKNLLTQQLHELQRINSENEAIINKKLILELQEKFEESWKNYFENSTESAKKILQAEIITLKEHWLQLLEQLKQKIIYLQEFLNKINQEIDSIEDRMKTRKEIIIDQIKNELKKNFPPQIYPQVEAHLNQGLFKKFRNNEITANDLQSMVQQELSDPSLRVEILAAADSQSSPVKKDLEQKLESRFDFYVERTSNALQNNSDLKNEIDLYTAEQARVERLKDIHTQARNELCHLVNQESQLSGSVIRLDRAAESVATETPAIQTKPEDKTQEKEFSLDDIDLQGMLDSSTQILGEIQTEKQMSDLLNQAISEIEKSAVKEKPEPVLAANDSQFQRKI
jgi:hypothetical protein